MSLSIERRGDLWGDRLAVADHESGERVSYAELADRVRRAAGRLAALGVEPGDPVAVVSRNRVEVLVLLFAARRVGAVFAPVSHRLTPATVERPFERLSSPVVVHEAAQRDLVRELPDERTQTFAEFESVRPEAHDREIRGSDATLAALHTEGGERAVELSARAVEWNCVTEVAAWGLGRDDSAPLLLPLSATDGLLCLTLPLLYVGGTVVLQRAFDPVDILDAVADHGATYLFGGATEYRELVDRPAFAATDLTTVRWFVTRDRLEPDVRESVAKRAPVVRSYGRPETGAHNLYRPPGSDGTEAAGEGDESVSPDASRGIGLPFPDCSVRLVDAVGTPVAEAEAGSDGADANANAVGELEVRGPVTATGYLGGERFGEWVPTGDVARRADGHYELVGRADGALTTGEEYVNPRAVERVLESHRDVSGAGVVSVGGTVHALVVGDPDPGELRGFAAERLPDEAVPREIEVVEALPRERSGDVDRPELRRRVERASERGRDR